MKTSKKQTVEKRPVRRKPRKNSANSRGPQMARGKRDRTLEAEMAFSLMR